MAQPSYRHALPIKGLRLTEQERPASLARDLCGIPTEPSARCDRAHGGTTSSSLARRRLCKRMKNPDSVQNADKG